MFVSFHCFQHVVRDTYPVAHDTILPIQLVETLPVNTKIPCVISLYYIKNQQDATLAVLFISNCNITLHVSDASRVNHQEY